MNHLDHANRRIHYRRDESASGPTVLCVHGSGGSTDVWRAQVGREDGEGLGGAYDVVALDLAGHGDSEDADLEPGSETLSAYADDVAAVAESVDATAVVGHSLGGAVALHAVIEGDLDPAALVLAGTGAKLSIFPDLLEWCRDDPARAIDFMHEPGRLFVDPEAAPSGRSEAIMREMDSDVFYRDFATCDAFDVRDRLEEVDMPTLAVTGAEDVLTPPDFSEYLAEHLPDARWTTIADAAHLSMMERPAEFDREVSSFITEVTE